MSPYLCSHVFIFVFHHTFSLMDYHPLDDRASKCGVLERKIYPLNHVGILPLSYLRSYRYRPKVIFYRCLSAYGGWISLVPCPFQGVGTSSNRSLPGVVAMSNCIWGWMGMLETGTPLPKYIGIEYYRIPSTSDRYA